MFKIKEGTIRNLNKKIVTGALVTTLIMTGLTGCNKTGFSYEKKSQEQVLVTGSEEYSIVSGYLVAEIEIEGEKKLYIIEPYYDLKNENILNCKDVFTGENLISIDLEKRKVLDDKKMFFVEELGKYLVNINEVKDEYNIKDLERILETIEKDYYTDTFELIKK